MNNHVLRYLYIYVKAHLFLCSIWQKTRRQNASNVAPVPRHSQLSSYLLEISILSDYFGDFDFEATAFFEGDALAAGWDAIGGMPVTVGTATLLLKTTLLEKESSTVPTVVKSVELTPTFFITFSKALLKAANCFAVIFILWWILLKLPVLWNVGNPISSQPSKPPKNATKRRVRKCKKSLLTGATKFLEQVGVLPLKNWARSFLGFVITTSKLVTINVIKSFCVIFFAVAYFWQIVRALGDGDFATGDTFFGDLDLDAESTWEARRRTAKRKSKVTAFQFIL